MSNTIRYDSLLIRQLAAELHAVLAGQRAQSLCFDREFRSVVLGAEQGTLRWPLTAGPSYSSDPPGDCAGQSLVLPRKARVSDVASLPDERILRLSIAGSQRANAAAILIVELLPPQSNVIALDDAGRVLKVLAPNAGRPQTRGQPYLTPGARNRAGVAAPISLADWSALLSQVAPAERAQTLIANVAFMSPINAGAVLGTAAVESNENELRLAYDRYLELVSGSARPCLIETRFRAQPYGNPLWQPATPANSLLDAFGLAAAQRQPLSDPIARLEQAVERVRRKVDRLEAEHAGGAEVATRLRSDADLLSAHLHSVKRGHEQVELTDFNGTTRVLRLDPSTSPAANAQAWYAEARKRERAAQRLPALIETARREVTTLQDKLERVKAGEVVDLPSRPPSPRRTGKPEGKLPYHRFRTSGGLEVRVGRNSRANDELTLHYAAPDDIWLHARATGGAHVVLRWTDPLGNPPQRDLEQAAALAALHSKGRHAGVVPVDWTRRKYVRKPRQAPAGTVRVERVKTVFVTPGHNLLEKLRWTE